MSQRLKDIFIDITNNLGLKGADVYMLIRRGQVSDRSCSYMDDYLDW